MNRPSIKQLEYFIAVARTGSFRGAAEGLSISQPTITTQIANLESLLEVQLFERGRAGTSLSPAGRHLLPHARLVTERLDALLEEASSAGSEGMTYRLGVKSTFGPYALPRILPAIHEKYTNLRLYVQEEAPPLLESQLELGELDLILTSFPTNTAAIIGEQLIVEDIKLVMSKDHPMASTDVVRAEDLRGERILTTREGHHFTRLVEQTALRFGAEVQRDYQSTSLDAVRLMVVMGMGIAFLPALYIHSEITADSDLVVKEIEGESIARILGLAWRPTSPARKFYERLAQDLRDALEHEFGSVVRVSA